MWNNLFKSQDLLQKGLSAAWTRNAVIRNNIANVETPFFKASDVEFESLLRQAMMQETGGFIGSKTHAKHLDIGTGSVARTQDLMSVNARIIQRRDLSMRMDLNNVDIEAENVKLAQNSLYYNTILEKMNSEIRRLRTAIMEGR